MGGGRLLVSQKVTFPHLSVRIPLRSPFVGVRQPPPLLSLVNTKITSFSKTVKKIHISIAFSKLLKMLKWRLYISMAFFGGYLLAPSATLPFPPSFFGNEGAKVVHMSCNFLLRLTCNFSVFIFQMFLYQQKVLI